MFIACLWNWHLYIMSRTWICLTMSTLKSYTTVCSEALHKAIGCSAHSSNLKGKRLLYWSDNSSLQKSTKRSLDKLWSHFAQVGLHSHRVGRELWTGGSLVVRLTTPHPSKLKFCSRLPIQTTANTPFRFQSKYRCLQAHLCVLPFLVIAWLRSKSKT